MKEVMPDGTKHNSTIDNSTEGIASAELTLTAGETA
jgi:hypothetical protein